MPWIGSRELRASTPPQRDGHSSDGAEDLGGGIARSPAVGYFTPAPDLAVGRSVIAGDLLGSIDVLGIGQEVSAPEDGVIATILAEDGQAVEYGQELFLVAPA